MQMSYLDAVDACYAALDEGGGLDALLGQLGTMMGAAAGDIVSENAATGEVRTFGSFGFDPVYRESYDTDFLGVNPWADELASGPGNCVHTDIEDRPGFSQSAYFNEWVRPQGLGRSVGARLSGSTDRTVWVGFARARGERAFSGQPVDTLERLLPHLNRLTDLSLRLQPARNDPLAAVREPALLIGPDRRVIACNAAGEGLIDGSRLLRTRENRLAFVEPRDEARFRRALAAVTDVMNPDAPPLEGHGIVCLAHDREGGVTGLHLHPFALSDPHLGSVRRVALVLLCDWQTRPRPDLRPLALEFGLTQTERELVEFLSAGGRLDGFAEGRGMAVSTARWHLKNAEAKTGTSRAEQLVALAYQRGFPCHDPGTDPLE